MSFILKQPENCLLFLNLVYIFLIGQIKNRPMRMQNNPDWLVWIPTRDF